MSYEPTEYEQLLLAAGWVTIADLDDEYILWKKEWGRHHTEPPMSRDQWQFLMESLEAISQEYDLKFGSTYPLTENERIEAEHLLREMQTHEFLLGF